MKNRFRVKYLVFLLTGVFLLFLGAVTLHIARVGIIEEVYMYADISECSNLQKIDNHAIVVLYESPTDDEVLRNLDYNSFFGCNYTASNLRFSIFAYTFNSEKDAQQYYYNATGKHLANDKTSFTMDTGIFSGPLDLVVIDGTQAYRIETFGKYYKEMTTCLKECFSVDIMKK